VEDLLAAWNQLIARHTADPGATGAGQRLLDAWADPRRTYHCMAHLRDVLSRVDELAAYADDPDAVRLAAWYHDAVYAGLPDDEERSAQFAEGDLTELGVSPAMVSEVARLVRMTVTHDPAPGDRNGETLSDADLSALAVPGEQYRRNTADIRAEYTHIPDEVFRKGRVQVLVALLESPALFRTDHGHRQWEDAARANMRAELADLGGG
jgi:predicted metal-dependent HD superfamily phosphohydrolase